MSNHIYLDHSATTPVHPDVVAAMQPYWHEQYGNASSGHQQGRASNRGLAQARRTIADWLHANPNDIIFTGCGSEADNLALRGVMWAAREAGRGNHLITCAVEHPAVLKTAKQLRDLANFDLTILPVDQYGQIDLGQLRAAIRPDTVLISLMVANNEIGTYQPFLEAGAIAHEHNILFHTDAVQAAAHLAWDMTTMPIDLLTLAPHKFYGPKGIGILYIRPNTPLLSPLTGGSQENGHRAGTHNVPLAVGAAAAFDFVQSNRQQHLDHYQPLRDQLINGVRNLFPSTECQLTGHPTNRLAHHTSFAFNNISGNDLVINLDMMGICAASGSACSTGNPKPSSILEAINLSPDWTTGGLRLTVGLHNTPADIDATLDKLPRVIKQLRQFQQTI
ncbi:MAG TPA: cysteine desulfurase family protein [Anaerolineae bacterium]|nr:cysteine desulfurase family protein [Anaerolineae bacterium]